MRKNQKFQSNNGDCDFTALSGESINKRQITVSNITGARNLPITIELGVEKEMLVFWCTARVFLEWFSSSFK